MAQFPPTLPPDGRIGQAVRDALGRLPQPREPEWADFIDAEGRLLPIERLRRESPEERDQRRAEVDLALVQRQALFRSVASSNIAIPQVVRDPANVFFGGRQAVDRQIEQLARRYAHRLRPTAAELSARRQFDLRSRANVLPAEEVRREILRRDDFMQRLIGAATKPRPAAEYPPHYQRMLDAAIRQAEADVLEEAAANQRTCLILPQRERTTIRIFAPGLPEDERRRLDQAAQFIGAITRKGRLSDPRIAVGINKELAAGAMRYRNGAIEFNPPTQGSGFIHEMAHHLQHHVSGLGRDSAEWRRRVSKGGKLQLMGVDSQGRSWYYRERTDGRAWLRDYMGRVYFRGDPMLLRVGNIPEEDNDRMEVVSCACEILFSNPVEIARHDPELVTLLIDSLRSNVP